MAKKSNDNKKRNRTMPIKRPTPEELIAKEIDKELNQATDLMLKEWETETEKQIDQWILETIDSDLSHDAPN